MNGKFTHYLVTRFNVSIANWDMDKSGSATLDASWMNHRIHLFKTFCAPSIAGQTNMDFKWLIYCDPHTPAPFVESIKNSIALIPHAELRFVNDFDALKTDLKQLISSGTSAYVITSRVDNDDALGKTFIKTVQEKFIEADRTVINLCGGVLYDLPMKVLTMLPDMRFNHFGSLIEKRKNTTEFLTVMGFSHHDPPSEAKVVDVNSKFAWLKIIHDRNLKSRTIGIPVFSSNLVQHFTIEKNIMPISRINSIVYFFKRGITVLFNRASK
jgi:hypothetical protein